MPITSFDPQIHGFHFRNSFVNHLILGIETYGLCGGMAFASLDYFHAGRPAPSHEAADFPAGGVPPEGSLLRDYIYGRMVDTLARNGLTWLRVVGGPLFNPVRFTKNRIPALLSALDSGTPVALGLIGSLKVANAGGGNHQVVCFGYEKSPDGKTLTLHIYDNNYPDETVTLQTDPANPADIQYSKGSKWLAFFMENYKQKTPGYQDLMLTSGIHINLEGPTEEFASPRSLQLDDDGRPAADSGPVRVQFQEAGKPFSANFTVRNFGQFPARPRRLVLIMTDPSDDNTFFGATEIQSAIAPGATAGCGKQLEAFPNEPGGYTLRAAFVNRSNEQIRVPERPATDNEASFHAVAPAVRRVPKAPARKSAGASQAHS
ncbi:MAG: hypothetical protein JNM66_15805 [Bryobacterales bacterium]|nr:hypothetical protein [Bryobacterales bacterium]